LKDETSTSELTDRLKAAEEALLRGDRLAVANRFAGAIIHEVNNPLEALTNLVFLTKIISSDERVLENMATAEAQLARLGEITRKSLDFYRDEQQAREFDLVDIAEAALTIHKHRLLGQKVDMRKRFRTPAMAKVVAGEILQVVSNLILNALDALPEHGSILFVRLRSCSRCVHLTISDNGSGIEPEIYKKLFQGNRTTKAHGTGFGLWLCKSIVEKHGGAILTRTSRRQGHQGTTFRVSLPIIGQPPKAA
jgi:signal transduction histidine kinase